MNTKTPEKISSCPDIHYFGAAYPDAGCIDGFLWDLDSGSEPGQVDIGGEIPCPFCNEEAYIEHIKDDMHTDDEINDEGNLTITDEEMLSRAKKHVENLHKKYL